jgi:hypothetical protein
MRSRLFKLMSCALGLGLASCGESEQSRPLPWPTNTFGQTGGAGAAGSGTAGAMATPGSASAGGGFDFAAPTPIDSPLTEVVKSNGCGTQLVVNSGAKVTIKTQGTKQADCADKLDDIPICGAWSTTRDYYVFLPANYDPNKAYPLVFEAPGCGGNGTDVAPINNNADNTVIRIGLTSGPNSVGHGTNPGQGCFDTSEGDDSIDWVFYENMYDNLNAKVCFDRNRVFAAGNRNGAWLANELGCKYAGDPLRPLRGVLSDTGGLPTDPQYVPRCRAAPMTGMWVHELNDTTNPFAGVKVAIDRAMALADCASGHDFDTAQLEKFPIGGGQPDDTCQHIVGCDPLYPLVVCPLLRTSRVHDSVVNPGWSTFIKTLETAPLLTP